MLGKINAFHLYLICQFLLFSILTLLFVTKIPKHFQGCQDICSSWKLTGIPDNEGMGFLVIDAKAQSFTILGGNTIGIAHPILDVLMTCSRYMLSISFRSRLLAHRCDE